MKKCTDISQSNKFLDLGIDINTSDMMWIALDWQETDYYMEVKNDGFEMPKRYIPAWSLIALIELIPDKISINNESYYLFFTKKSVGFRGPITWDGQKAKSFEMDNILDAAFEMICWLKENGKI